MFKYLMLVLGPSPPLSSPSQVQVLNNRVRVQVRVQRGPSRTWVRVLNIRVRVESGRVHKDLNDLKLTWFEWFEKMDLAIIATASKESNMKKMLEKQRMCRSWRIFPHEQQLQKNKNNKKTVVDHSGNDTQYKNQVICLVFCVCILSCGLGY